MKAGEQIIKARDDRGPVKLEPDDTNPLEPYKAAAEQDNIWLKAEETTGPVKLRGKIEPWLTALVQSEHLTLLVGSGLVHAVHRMATDKGPQGLDTVDFSEFKADIAKAALESSKAAGRKEGNFEDQVRTAGELLAGLRILGDTYQSKKDALSGELTKALQSFANSILADEKRLAESNAVQRENAYNYLVSFLMSFASRSGTRDRLHIFTTNYDRLIELGAELAGLHLLDRFVGSVAPVFRSSRLDIDIHYNPPGIRGEPRYLEGVARFTKLHGSVDWIQVGDSIRRVGLPFGASKIDHYLKAPGFDGADALKLMIYPNSAKDRETAAYPYVELFRDLAAAVCRPNSTVVTYGYSFGDEHINRVLEDMLTIPSTHLVIISHGDPLDRIMNTYEKLGRPSQITILLGDHLGNLKELVDWYLPKPAIDKTTFRMAELLRSRLLAGGLPSGSSTPEEES